VRVHREGEPVSTLTQGSSLKEKQEKNKVPPTDTITRPTKKMIGKIQEGKGNWGSSATDQKEK